MIENRIVALPFILFITAFAVIGCQSASETVTPFISPTIDDRFEEIESTETVTPVVSGEPQETVEPTDTPAPVDRATISINISDPPIALNKYILGTNLPAWLSPSRMENNLFLARTLAAGVSLIRIPGGSWSNYYDWLACERGGIGIDETAECYWPWATRPTDFLNFLNDTHLEGMYTVNMNGTTREAAALVAFFNGSVDDNTVIGLDVRGRDWGRVSDWANLRSDNGNPEPIGIQYWEIGNENYGGNLNSGTDCTEFGWEDVWTCDGTEYVNGIGSGPNRREGFLEYRDAMQAVDPTILVGAVGVPFQTEWSDWGNEVIAAAGDVMDFYIIHHYGFFNAPDSYTAVLAEPHTTWLAIMSDVRSAFDEHVGGLNIPIAVTEYNLFSVGDQDNNQLMIRTINALYMADTIGQMMANGVQITAQWNLANGQAVNGSDYGLVHADTYDRYPAYYIFRLWSQFGSKMFPLTNSLAADTSLSVYAGQNDEDTITILAVNKTGEAVEASILLENSTPIINGFADILAGESLDSLAVTFNGQNNAAADFSDVHPSPIEVEGNPFIYTFTPYSVTLLQLKLAS